jgi:hypothetical protein
MKHKIPNTNLTLTETEIQAVVDFAYQRSIGSYNRQIKEKELEIPARFKNIINTGNIKKKTGNTKIILKPNEGYYREDTDS